MATEANLALVDLVRQGYTGTMTGQVVVKKFTLIASTGQVSIRFDKRFSQRKLVNIYREITAAVAGRGAAVTCSVNIVLNKDISTDNPNWDVWTFRSVDELRDADLPGGEDMLTYDRASFHISASN